MTDHTVAREVERKTKESDIVVELDLDGTGVVDIDTGVPFYDHMLTSLGSHASFDLTVRAKGDIEIEGHHTIEDTAIVLGQALGQALGRQEGHPPVRRRVHPDGRDARPRRRRRVGPAVLRAHRRAGAHGASSRSPAPAAPYHTVVNRHVFESLAFNARIALHVRTLYGRDPHHITEAQYKAVARALRQAVEYDPRVSGVPSTKGTL